MSTWTTFDGKRILMVDDSRAVRIFLEDVLSRHGARVEEAAAGAEALARLEGEERFDLVLLDLVLPDMDGMEVLRRIRERDEDVPVVMITGSGGIQSATAAVRRGADGYIEKQHLSGGGEEDDAAFLHALRQAAEHRAGHVAQKQLQALRTDFYSMVTHDLRNPAGSLWGIVRMLLSGKAGPLTERQEQLLRVAETSGAKLMGLINDYLDYATIDAGYLRLERREAELGEVVRGAVRQAGPQAEVKRLTLEADLPAAPVRARVDAERLGQVLDNLLSNAIKYTPEGGGVGVKLRQAGGHALLWVRDSGVGIPPDQIPALFTKYHRVPGETTRAIRGTGLGLLIVKEIVEAHGGVVRVESEGVPGKGSTFVVSIPLDDSLVGGV